VLVKNFQYGGTQRVLLRLANKLHDYGYGVQLVCAASGPLEATLHDGIARIHLEPGRRFLARGLALRANPAGARHLLLPLVLPLHPVKALPLLAPLARYLKETPPNVLISGTASLNVITTLAKRLAQAPTALVLTEHVTTDQRRITDRRFARRFLPELMRRTYRDADAIVGVSNGVANDLRELLQVPVERVRCIYNPAVPDNVNSLAGAPVAHRWFDVDQPPVILSAGRAGRLKDFSMLVRAFARLRHEYPVRLVILSSAAPGSIQRRHLDELRALAVELRVAPDFEILDFTANPFAYMARAGVFASSSASEGFGNVVAEALACGCPVVSTRTNGPVEVLDNGRYGRIVPVGDVGAMAAALRATLSEPRNSPEFVMRAAAFSEERAARAYEALCGEVSEAHQSLSV
jgi:glycosyltransferase involved in cell wall biosynthesis